MKEVLVLVALLGLVAVILIIVIAYVGSARADLARRATRIRLNIEALTTEYKKESAESLRQLSNETPKTDHQ